MSRNTDDSFLNSRHWPNSSDRGIMLAEALIEMLRQQRIILPAIDVIERVCSEALTLGTRGCSTH